MPYNPNIPQPTDSKSVSQGQMLGNFQEINTFVNVNHGPFGATDEGKHRLATFPVQLADPVTLAGEATIYAKNANGKANLWVRKESNGSFIPFTNSTLDVNPTPAPFSDVATWIPSALLLFTGSATGITGLNTTTILNAALTQLISVQITPLSASTSDVNFAVRLVDIPAANQFRVFVSSRTSIGAATGGYTYFAVGY